MPKLKVYDHEFYFIKDCLIVKSPQSMVRLPREAAMTLFDMIGAVLLAEAPEIG